MQTTLITMALCGALALGPLGAARADDAPADDLLNRAYAMQQSNPAGAVDLFRQALAIDPRNVKARTDLAYLLLDLDRKNEALAEFEKVLELDPKNDHIVLQTGYLLADLDRPHEAYTNFSWLARVSDDPEIRQTARIAAINLSGSRWRRDGSRWFLDVDLDAWVGQRRDLSVFALRLAFGTHLDAAGDTDLYASIREYLASGTDIDILPSPFSERSMVVAIGVRTHPFNTPQVLAFAEVGSAVDEAAAGREIGDVRGGLVFYDQWRPETRAPYHAIHPWDRSAELYGELVYFSRFDDNVILFVRHREGRRAFETASSYLDVYLFGQGWLDANGDFSNNVGEVGLGARFWPDKRTPFNIWVEGLRGMYFGTRDRPSTLSASYGDLRFGLTASLPL